MKILVTVNGFLTPSMTFVYNQIQAFKEAGHQVKVVACELMNQDRFPWEEIVNIPIQKGVSHYFDKLKRHLGWGYDLGNRSFTKGFQAEIESFSPDIIHVHFGTHLLKVFPATRDFDIPVVATFHGYDASQYLRISGYVDKLKSVMSSPRCHGTTVSADMKRRLGEKGIPMEQTYVDYLGVDTEFFRSQTKKNQQRPFTFLQVSNFVEKKGHEYTLRAFASHLRQTKGEDEVLVLAGAGPLLDSMQALATEEGIAEKVRFPGLVDRVGVRSLMKEADVFVHHSVTAANGDMEGLPTVIMEAMAMELPVISTYHSGIPELMDDRDYGILVEERDVAAYATAFTSIKNCNARTSRKKIVSDFNLSYNSRNILGIFDAILNEH